jgi:hypothetical protein
MKKWQAFIKTHKKKQPRVEGNSHRALREEIQKVWLETSARLLLLLSFPAQPNCPHENKST